MDYKKFEQEQGKFIELINQKYKQTEQAILPIIEGVGTLAWDIDQTFGTFLKKILFPLNSNTKLEHSYRARISGSKAWYFIKPSGKKVLIDPASLFQFFDESFVHTVKDLHKKKIANEFLQFKNAVCLHLNNANLKGPIVLPEDSNALFAQLIEVNCVQVHNPLKRFGPNSTITPTVYFNTDLPSKTRIWKIHIAFPTKINYSSNRKFGSNDMPPSATLFVFSAHELLGALNIQLVPDVGNGCAYNYSLLHLYNGHFNDAELIPWHYEFSFDYWDHATKNEHSAKVWYSSGTPINIQNTLGPGFFDNVLRIKYTSFDIGENVILNWDEILQNTEIQDRIKEYIKVWQQITKAWNHLQNKYSYRLLTGGHF